MTIGISEGLERLQPPATEYLIGRFNEICALDDAFRSDKIAIVGICAAGGTGKSALVREWIRSLEADQGRKVDCLFSWTFFDEEKGLPNSTSDEFFHRIFRSRCLSECTGEGGSVASLAERSPAPKSTFPDQIAKDLLAEYQSRKMILVLDNTEVLQRHGIGNEEDGRFYDTAIKQFLTDLANCGEQSHKGRLVIVTSRELLTDLSEFLEATKDKTDQVFLPLNLSNLTVEDGVQLLRELGVKGEAEDLRNFAEDYQNHALTLVLLGRLVVETGRTDHAVLRHELSNVVPPDHEAPSDPRKRDREHARTLLMYYVSGGVLQPQEEILLSMMALFHRPMEKKERDHLLRHAELCKDVAHLSESEWSSVHQRLERFGLLLPQLDGTPVRWNSHALVREYFRDEERNKRTDLWRQANSVLYDYFIQLPVQDRPEKRKDLLPLHRAVHHGCHSGRYSDALDMYRDRILQGDLVSHGANELGTIADDCAALRMFFKPFGSELQDEAAKQLDPEDCAWLQGRTSFCLAYLGRLGEALEHRTNELQHCRERLAPIQSVADSCDRTSFENAAHASARLSELHLFVGELESARSRAQEALDLARRGGSEKEEIHSLCRLAAVEHMKGNFNEARSQFTQALAAQEHLDPGKKALHSDFGYLHRRFLFERGFEQQDSELQPHQYNQLLVVAQDALNYDRDFQPKPIWLIPIALGLLSKAEALTRKGRFIADKWTDAKKLFNEALDTLTRSGSVIYLPEYFLALAIFYRLQRFHTDAKACAARALQYAKDYNMPLYEVDANIELARNHLADSAKDKARDCLEMAESDMRKYGYHRLRSELARLCKNADSDQLPLLS